MNHAPFAIGLVISPEAIESTLVREDHSAATFTPIGEAVHVALVCVTVPVLHVRVDQVRGYMCREFFFELLLGPIRLVLLASACTLHMLQVASLPFHLLLRLHVEGSRACTTSPLAVVKWSTLLEQATY